MGHEQRGDRTSWREIEGEIGKRGEKEETGREEEG
jgi:hypothetical protein